MRHQRITVGQLAAAIGFAFSCFGLLLFLWTAFGGPIPFKPEGYRIKVPVDEGTQLAQESDVRISNVSVGKVKDIELGDEGDQDGLAVTTIEVDAAYAPLPADTRATLRQKTLLGETYMELTPGNPDSGDIAEGGSLPAAQTSNGVQLDEIFRTFDPRTRAAFQQWMQGAAIALNGRGADLNAALGNLDAFARDGTRLLRVLDTQSGAVSGFVRNTGVVFNALSERQGQLRSLIQNSDTVFRTTARRNDDLRQIFTIFPTFLDESRQTVNRLDRFAADTDPLVVQLEPATRQLSYSLVQLGRLAPHLKGFFRGFRKVASAAKTGFPALRRTLDTDLPPFLSEFTPFFNETTPILAAVNRYRREVTAFLGNATAATEGSSQSQETSGVTSHYLRTMSPLAPESLAAYPTHRLQVNRTNPYVAPGGYSNVKSALQSFETRDCTAPPGVNAHLNPADAPLFPNDLFTRIQTFAFAGLLDTADPNFPKPGCTQQGQQKSIGSPSENSFYPHVYANP
jgi:phospholipid/cholesterol/gamma-HCH transport system substrate-binding protein